MADTKISALTAGTAAATDRIPTAISPFGATDNRHLTPVTLGAYINANIANGSLATPSLSHTSDVGTGTGWYRIAAQQWGFAATGGDVIRLLAGLVGLTVSTRFAWVSSADWSGSADTGIARSSAGYLELNQGTAGTLDSLIDSEVFATTVSAKALANDNSLQAVFASANDVLTLRPTTTYFFEAQYFVNTGSTTHTTATAFTASSAFTSITYWAELWSTTAGTISTTAPSVLNVGVSTAVVLNATSTATRTTIRIKGIIRTNAATTVTPQIQFSADPTSTCEVAANSFFRAWPVGTNTVAVHGDWA